MGWRCKRWGHKWIVIDATPPDARRYRLDHCKRCPSLRIFDKSTGREYAES